MQTFGPAILDFSLPLQRLFPRRAISADLSPVYHCDQTVRSPVKNWTAIAAVFGLCVDGLGMLSGTQPNCQRLKAGLDLLSAARLNPVTCLEARCEREKVSSSPLSMNVKFGFLGEAFLAVSQFSRTRCGSKHRSCRSQSCIWGKRLADRPKHL